MSQNRVLSIEFNELCPNLIDQYIAEGRLPHFAALRSQSHIFTTDAEAEGEWLNPWVQWVTYHTGLSWEDHKIFTLSQGHLLDTKATWDLLSDVGKKVWVCSSMNPRADMPLNGHLLPDPWSTGVKPTPEEEFDEFYRFVQNAVQEHSSGKEPVNSKAFVKYMLKHGISFSTLARTARQLIEEKLTKDKWKRAMILDHFLLDVFEHIYRKSDPDYSTFFLNSTAHFQHCYWRHMSPESFDAKPSHEEIQKYGKAIRSGYENMDSILGRLMKIVGNETSIVFATALSQQPYLKDEESGGRRYYRLKDVNALKKHGGISSIIACEHVMADQFILKFSTRQDRDDAKCKIESFQLDNTSPFRNENPQLMIASENSETALMCQCRCTGEVPKDSKVILPDQVNVEPFDDLFYQFSTVKSGCHHPEGVLWIRHGQDTPLQHQEKVSLRRVAPTILNLFEVSTPAYMAEPPLPLSTL